jgi:putative transposase
VVKINEVLAWRQPDVVWINQPPDELGDPGQLPFVQAA